jgi:hypothetical protein
VTSLVQLSREAEFTRGPGALYDAVAAGEIGEEALAGLLADTLPRLIDGDQGQAWAGEHDAIDYGLLESALAGLPPDDARAVREACARWRRLRFAIDATPFPRAGRRVLPGPRACVHHDACRCDGARKTIPGWEYQFAAALGHLRTAWTASPMSCAPPRPAARARREAVDPGPHPFHATLPAALGRPVRVEDEYVRHGALALLVGLDAHTGQVLASTPKITGSPRVFVIVDNGLDHRGRTAVGRIREAHPNAVMIHTPVHARRTYGRTHLATARRCGSLQRMSGHVDRASIVSGYFNPLHVGHLRMMEAARSLTGRLIV